MPRTKNFLKNFVLFCNRTMFVIISTLNYTFFIIYRWDTPHRVPGTWQLSHQHRLDNGNQNYYSCGRQAGDVKIVKFSRLFFCLTNFKKWFSRNCSTPRRLEKFYDLGTSPIDGDGGTRVLSRRNCFFQGPQEKATASTCFRRTPPANCLN